MIEHPAFVHKLAREILVLRSEAVGMADVELREIEPGASYTIEVLDRNTDISAPGAVFLVVGQDGCPVCVAQTVRYLPVFQLLGSESEPLRINLYRELDAEAKARITQAQQVIERLRKED